MEALWEAGATVRAYDPVARDEARRIYGERPTSCCASTPRRRWNGADALAIVTEWREFRSPDFDDAQSHAARPCHFRRPQPVRSGDAEEAGH